MSTLTLRPDSDILNEWGTSGYAMVSDASDATAAGTVSANKSCRYGLPNTIPAGAVTSKVTLYMRCKYGWAETPTIGLVIKTESTLYTYDHVISNTTTTYSDELATNPNTSAAWTVDEINALEIGMNSKNITEGWAWLYVYDLWAIVDYTEPSVTVTPSTITMSYALPAPTVSNEATATPGTITLTYVLPAVVVPQPVTITPSTITMSYTVPTPTIEIGAITYFHNGYLFATLMHNLFDAESLAPADYEYDVLFRNDVNSAWTSHDATLYSLCQRAATLTGEHFWADEDGGFHFGGQGTLDTTAFSITNQIKDYTDYATQVIGTYYGGSTYTAGSGNPTYSISEPLLGLSDMTLVVDYQYANRVKFAGVKYYGRLRNYITKNTLGQAVPRMGEAVRMVQIVAGEITCTHSATVLTITDADAKLTAVKMS
jgi:hypothetical protein